MSNAMFKNRGSIFLLALMLTLSATTTQAHADGSVSISGFAFSPAVIEVPAGSRVTWTNQDKASHSIVGDTDSAVFSSDTMKQGDRFGHTFSLAGTYKYRCGFHKYMTGAVVVK